VDADRNKRCVEEGMLHGFRTRAAGSDAEVAAPMLSLYLTDNSRVSECDKIVSFHHRERGRRHGTELLLTVRLFLKFISKNWKFIL